MAPRPASSSSTRAPEMGIDPASATRRRWTPAGHDRHRPRRDQRAEHRQQLRVPRRPPLLRRRHLPPHHQRLHVPGRRPHRHRPRRPRLQVRRRAGRSRRYQIGSVAMANAGPNTNGSQFFLISGPSGVGLPPQYNHFGQVVKGLDVRRAMQNVDDRSRRSAARRRRDQLGHHHRRRLSQRGSARPSRWRQRAASRSARRASPTRGPTGRVDRRHFRASARSDRADPDRLGQRAGAQPGAAAVRPPRAAPAQPDRRRHGGRRAVRVLGARGHRTSDMAHYHLHRWKMAARAQVGARLHADERAPGLHRGGATDGSSRTARSRPATSSERVGKKGTWWDWDDAKVALEHLFWTGRVDASTAGRATSPGSTT